MRRVCWAATVPAIVLILVTSSTSLAQEPDPKPDRIEEDWKVVIASPDPDTDGPQITTYMTPKADGVSSYVVFHLNYRDHPSYQGGGVQMQGWRFDQIVSSSSQGSSKLRNADETITWTQRMSYAGGQVTYSIENGESTSWGKFGQGHGLLNIQIPTALTSLAEYNPEVSVAKSGVGWQPNRVAEMTLERVRYFKNNEIIAVDDTPRSVTLDTNAAPE